MIGIYSIRNTLTGDQYIGSSRDIKFRWWCHRRDLSQKCHDNPRLQNAWNKYGSNTFEFHVLETLANSDQLLDREQAYLDAYQPAYNIATTARSPMLGKKHTPETLEKMRARFLGKSQTPEHIEKRRQKHLGFRHSDESRARMSETRRGKPQSPEHAEKSRRARLGLKHTPETIERMKQAWILRKSRSNA